MRFRRLLGYNLLSAVVLGIVGFYVGWWLGHQINAPSLAYVDNTGQNDIALFLAYLVGVVGFLFGLGFASYPIQRLLGKPPSLREKETAGPGRYFTLCTDHKVVGIPYLIGSERSSSSAA
jgi:membrane protein DedA with SNARE-associated domain